MNDTKLSESDPVQVVFEGENAGIGLLFATKGCCTSNKKALLNSIS
jgi:hypothetical protein